MGLASPRVDLGKIGRVHVIYNEVSEPADDVLQQDIKGHPKLRYPHWDFVKTLGRKPLLQEDSLGCPGKYDVNLDTVSAVPKEGVAFDKLSRTVNVANLGYIAPAASVHPEHKRSPGGCVPDRSRAKDNLRLRAVNVNNFDKELPRPPLPAVSQEYHDLEDPLASCDVLVRALTYDADSADRSVTHRRDLAPAYSTMLPRGRDAVQGLRNLQGDTAVRGSVGLLFKETTGQLKHSVDAREGRAADGTRLRPDLAPRFEHYTLLDTLCVANNYVHGAPPVKGACDPKPPPLRRLQKSQSATATFHRGSALQGFTNHAKLEKKTLARPSRAHVELPGWSESLSDLGEKLRAAS